MKNYESMSEQELRAERGDQYQERENATAAAQNAAQTIMEINQELARRSAEGDKNSSENTTEPEE